MLTKSSTLVLNKRNPWHDHWTIFVGTSISNRLSTIKLIWNISFMPVRKINLRQKNLFFFQLRVNFIRCAVLLKVEFRRDEKVQKFDHLRISPGTSLISEIRYFIAVQKIWSITLQELRFLQLQQKTDSWLMWYLATNNDAKWTNSRKGPFYTTKSKKKTLFIISCKAMDDFVWHFCIITETAIGLVFAERSISKTLSTVKLI